MAEVIRALLAALAGAALASLAPLPARAPHVPPFCDLPTKPIPLPAAVGMT